MVGSFGVWRSTCQVWRSSMVYVWCMELCGRQFCLWRSTRVYGWGMEFYGRQFWSTEVNPGVCLVDGNKWSAVLV